MRSIRAVWAGWLAVCAVAIFPVQAQLSVCYRISELSYSNLTGAINVEPARLTDSGLMTGIIYYTNNLYSMMYYSPATGFVDLGNWNGMGTRGMDINESGQIAVQIGDQQKAMRYTPGVGFEDIGSLGGAGPESEHTSLEIAENGDIAGMSDTPGIESHAFFWSQTRGMQDLGSLGGWFSRANGLNDQGWVSGVSRVADGSRHAFVYRPGHGMVDLGPGIAGDINNRGVVIGSQPNGLPMLLYDGKRVPVSSPFGVGSYSVGSINEHGLFIGTYFNSQLGVGFTAIIGSQNRGIVDLKSLVPPDSEWNLGLVCCINNKCEIVGIGTFQHRSAIFRLDPVVPSLSIRHSSTNVVLSWPQTFFPLQLEEAESAEFTAWQAVSGVTTNSATLPTTHTKRFYRLAIPPPPPPLP